MPPTGSSRSRWPKGKTAERGYGGQHQAERARWSPVVAAGQAWCARCGQRIAPGQPWDLDHDDHDRTRYRGPAHRACNRKAGGKLGATIIHARRRRARLPTW